MNSSTVAFHLWQFVLTFPLQVRHWLARSPELLSDVILNVTNVIKEFYEESTLRGADVDGALMPTNGAITFVQLFGSALNSNPHLHMIFLDGVFAQIATGKRFYAHPTFDTDCVLGILHAIYHRLDHLFKRLGFVTDDGEVASEPPVDDVPLPFKPRAPKAYRLQDPPVVWQQTRIPQPNFVQQYQNIRIIGQYACHRRAFCQACARLSRRDFLHVNHLLTIGGFF